MYMEHLDIRFQQTVTHVVELFPALRKLQASVDWMMGGITRQHLEKQNITELWKASSVRRFLRHQRGICMCGGAASSALDGPGSWDGLNGLDFLGHHSKGFYTASRIHTFVHTKS